VFDFETMKINLTANELNLLAFMILFGTLKVVTDDGAYIVFFALNCKCGVCAIFICLSACMSGT